MLKIVAGDITLTGNIVQTRLEKKSTIVSIRFSNLTLPQHRSLIHALYCQPGRWKTRNAPGELQSIGILLKILLRPLRLAIHQWKS